MCHSRGLNNRINKIPKRGLRIFITLRQNIKFTVLLQKDKSVATHMKNVECLATEIYKVKNCLSLEIMKVVFVFQENENYDLRSCTYLSNRNVHTAHFGTDTITNLEPKLCKLVPDEIKNASPLSGFKSKIKTCITDNYLFTLSRCPGGHPIFHRRLKLNSNIIERKY